MLPHIYEAALSVIGSRNINVNKTQFLLKEPSLVWKQAYVLVRVNYIMTSNIQTPKGQWLNIAIFNLFHLMAHIKLITKILQ